ncbi:hypothetical protein PUN4_550249 [Paraburkholderia unamae]|nr:hypothetical protein PUN4_550249 [Paraburkholderia unamae]
MPDHGKSTGEREHGTFAPGHPATVELIS